jgi:hypothetical protein
MMLSPSFTQSSAVPTRQCLQFQAAFRASSTEYESDRAFGALQAPATNHSNSLPEVDVSDRLPICPKKKFAVLGARCIRLEHHLNDLPIPFTLC